MPRPRSTGSARKGRGGSGRRGRSGELERRPRVRRRPAGEQEEDEGRQDEQGDAESSPPDGGDVPSNLALAGSPVSVLSLIPPTLRIPVRRRASA